MRTLFRLRTGAGVLAVLVAAATVAGCGSDGSGDPRTSGKAATSGATTEAADDGAASEVNVTMANDGGSDTCTLDTDSVAAGPVTFTITNESATGVTEVELLSNQKILGEKENLAPGLDPVSFTLTLSGGDHQIYCPGADPELVDLTVTGETSTEPVGDTQQALQDGAAEYAAYVDDQVASMVQGAQGLQAAVESGDLAASQKAYANARIYYERIESDVGAFALEGFKPPDTRGTLDSLIDMRPPTPDPPVGWHGFHAVERDLFGRQAITGS